MKYIHFDSSRPLDMVLLGRATIDLNPEDSNRPLSESFTYKKYIGGSPANVAIGLSRLGKKCGFLGRISNDQFGEFIINEFEREGVDISRVKCCVNGEKTGLTFTETLAPGVSSILMYRNDAADLSLSVEDIDEEYIKSAKALLISGTSLARTPSREAAFKALLLAERTDTPVIFDIDYRAYTWNNPDEISIYYALVADKSSIILGSREEYNLTEALINPGMNDAQSAAHWHSRKAKIVVIKHGKDGSTAYTSDGGSFSIKPFPTNFAKGFGGGDGYASAFLNGILDGKDIIDCLERGSASASMLISSPGCAPFMPKDEELAAFIAAAKEKYGEMIARK